MKDEWWMQWFFVGFQFFDNHGGWFNCLFKQVVSWRVVGANHRWGIAMASNFLIKHWKKKLKFWKNVKTNQIRPNGYELFRKIKWELIALYVTYELKVFKQRIWMFVKNQWWHHHFIVQWNNFKKPLHCPL
jgi:hypothetical protein